MSALYWLTFAPAIGLVLALVCVVIDDAIAARRSKRDSK
jgi:hypothetical protein